MKTTDERMRQVLSRANAVRARRRRQRQRAIAWGGGMASVAILVVVSLALSTANPDDAAYIAVGGGGLAASVFGGSALLGYLVVGLLGAFLGVALTILVYRLRCDDEDGSSGSDGR